MPDQTDAKISGRFSLVPTERPGNFESLDTIFSGGNGVASGDDDTVLDRTILIRGLNRLLIDDNETMKAVQRIK